LEECQKARKEDLARAHERLVAAEQSLKERLKFETLLAELSARFNPAERVSPSAGRLTSRLGDRDYGQKRVQPVTAW
jgi:two-component sensor histidine kinase